MLITLQVLIESATTHSGHALLCANRLGTYLKSSIYSKVLELTLQNWPKVNLTENQVQNSTFSLWSFLFIYSSAGFLFIRSSSPKPGRGENQNFTVVSNIIFRILFVSFSYSGTYYKWFSFIFRSKSLIHVCLLIIFLLIYFRSYSSIFWSCSTVKVCQWNLLVKFQRSYSNPFSVILIWSK